MSSIVGAMAIADLVKSTLGPKGMDKILQSTGGNRTIEVTNDGATILKSVVIDNPAAKVLIDISRVQDDEVGDGTTSVCVLAGELLRQAEQLIDTKLHPQVIAQGYRMAVDVARATLDDLTVDHSDDPAAFRQDLINIAKTTLSSKVLCQDKDYFSELAVNAVMKLKGSTNLEHIQIIKKQGGSLTDSYLDPDGFILDKKIGVGQPKRMENCKILVANTAMDTDKIKIYGTRVRVDSISKVAEIEAAEKEKMMAKLDKIKAHGCNVFVNRQLIYNVPEQYFADNGITAVEHADFDGIERLALVTGGDIVSTFDTPDKVVLGECALLEEIMIGEDKLIRFSGIPRAEACTVILRGANMHVIDEAERSLHDALCVLSQAVRTTRVVPGGGNCEARMAQAIDKAAKEVPGKKSLAMEAFARALMQIPTIIADNAGFDSSELVTELRAAHHNGFANAGLDMGKIGGGIGDMVEMGICESHQVKRQVLISAAEAAEMILRVDDIVQCAPRQRDENGM